MPTTRAKTHPRRIPLCKRSRASVSRPVQETLLGLAYQMHATRIVRVLPAVSMANASN